MKKIIMLLMVVVLTLTVAGCSDSEKKQESLLSSTEYSFERAIISRYEDDSFDVNIVEWKFLNKDMVYILDDKNREFLVDKTNVTFFSANQ